jgi:hypothetical protein
VSDPLPIGRLVGAEAVLALLLAPGAFMEMLVGGVPLLSARGNVGAIRWIVADVTGWAPALAVIMFVAMSVEPRAIARRHRALGGAGAPPQDRRVLDFDERGASTRERDAAAADVGGQPGVALRRERADLTRKSERRDWIELAVLSRPRHGLPWPFAALGRLEGPVATAGQLSLPARSVQSVSGRRALFNLCTLHVSVEMDVTDVMRIDPPAAKRAAETRRRVESMRIHERAPDTCAIKDISRETGRQASCDRGIVLCPRLERERVS